VAEQQQCEMVALEATGVYWKPVWHMLEAQFTLVLANPGHVRAIPAPTTSTGMTQPEPPLGSRRFRGTRIHGGPVHGLIQSLFVVV
jgi:hypothetical protein